MYFLGINFFNPKLYLSAFHQKLKKKSLIFDTQYSETFYIGKHV